MLRVRRLPPRLIETFNWLTNGCAPADKMVA